MEICIWERHFTIISYACGILTNTKLIGSDDQQSKWMLKGENCEQDLGHCLMQLTIVAVLGAISTHSTPLPTKPILSSRTMFNKKDFCCSQFSHKRQIEMHWLVF